MTLFNPNFHVILASFRTFSTVVPFFITKETLSAKVVKRQITLLPKHAFSSPGEKCPHATLKKNTI